MCVLLFFILVIGALVGLIKPKYGLFWKSAEKQSRKVALQFYSIALFLTFVCSVFVIFLITSTLKAALVFTGIFLTLLALLLFLLGLCFPKYAMFWKPSEDRTRKQVCSYYGSAFTAIVCLTLLSGQMKGSITVPSAKQDEKESASSAKEEKAMKAEEEKKDKERKDKEEKALQEEKIKKEKQLAAEQENKKKEEKEQEKKEKEKEQQIAKEKTRHGFDFEKEKKEVLDTIQKQKKTIKPEPMSKNTHFLKGSHFETGKSYDYVYIGKIKDGKPNGIGALYKREYEGFEGYDLYYAGHFKDGYFDGFGLQYLTIEESDTAKQVIRNSKGLPSFLAYEGEFKDSEYKGKGNKRLPLLYIDTLKLMPNEDFPERSVHYIEENEKVTRAATEKINAGEKIPFREDRTVPLETYVAHTGIYKNNEQNGKGKSYSDDTYLLYDGEYKNDDFDGEGTKYANGKILYRGSFSKGKYDGKGTLYNNEGKVEKKGKFVNDIWKGDN